MEISNILQCLSGIIIYQKRKGMCCFSAINSIQSKMSYISRRYYESRKEDPNAIWEYLDCIEKMAYHQFQDSRLIMEEVFCDDINICLYETERYLELRRNDIKARNLYFDMNLRKNPEKPMEYIKEMIDKGMIVGINTYFYDIPNFTWYKRDRYKESIHFCMVVGYDENGFWLIDVPENMKTEYLKDQHITTISYDDMKRYLAKQCNILTFEKNDATFSVCEDLDDLIKKMIKEYSSEPCFHNGKIIWKGKAAYERLLQLIKEDDPRLLEMDFYHGEFISFIISGRHDIFKGNILKKYGNNSTTEDVLQWLEICQNKWKILAYKILRENIKKGIYTPIEKDIYNIYESEKKLMECLKLFIK